MENNKITRNMLIAGGLIGLGMLGYHLLQGKSESEEEKELVAKKKSTLQPIRKKAVFKSMAGKVVEPQKKASKVLPVQEKKQTALPKADEFPLRVGSKGKRVECLQVYLLRNHGWAGVVTGDFDYRTQERVERFLKSKEVSESTYDKLKMEEPISKTP